MPIFVSMQLIYFGVIPSNTELIKLLQKYQSMYDQNYQRNISNPHIAHDSDKHIKVYSLMDDTTLTRIASLEAKRHSYEQCSPQDLSYHEFGFASHSDDMSDLANTLRLAHQRKPDSKIIERILDDPQYFLNSLWVHAPAVKQFLEKNGNRSDIVSISHAHFNSQSILLAFYLSVFGHKAAVYCSKNQVNRGLASCSVPLSEIDKISAFNSIVKSEGINLLHFENLFQQNIPLNNDIQIWDIFNTHPTIYRPFLLKRLQAYKNSEEGKKGNIIVYGSSIQAKEIDDLMADLNINAQGMEICQRYPYEIEQVQKLQEELIAFLKQEADHPNKQDIIIFHEPTSSFIRKLKQTLKKADSEFLTTTHFITAPNQTQKMIIPQQAPSVLKSNLSNISSTSTQQAPTNSASRTHNNIFIAPNFNTLISWAYEYDQVFYIFDYRRNRTFGYNYDTMVYEESSYDYISQQELAARASIVGVNKIGRYCYEQGNNIEPSSPNQQIAYLNNLNDNVDLGRYLLQMIQSGHAKKTNQQDSIFAIELQKSKQLRSCLQALEIAGLVIKDKQTNQYQIKNNKILEVLWAIEGLNPILCVNIWKASQESEDSKMATLLAMAVSVLMTPGNMRQIPLNSNISNDRPTEIWRQTGYLHSCLDILVRTKIIEKKQSLRDEKVKSRIVSKKTITAKLSKVNSCQYDVFGSLFEVLQAARMTFDQMALEDLLREERVNESVYHKVVEVYDSIVEALEIQEYTDFTSFSEINEVIESLTGSSDKGGGVFSGSRKIGYLMKGMAGGIFPSKASLITLLNERPPFIYVIRLTNNYSIQAPEGSNSTLQTSRKSQILMCNHITLQTFMSQFGALPTSKASSFGQSQIQFHGIPSAAFHYLWKNEARDILNFQQKHECFIEPNEQLAIITIHCPKQKQSFINKEFDELLNKVRLKLTSETKMMNYIGTTNVLLGAGGSLIQVVKDKYINKCHLSNICLNADLDDLNELFEEFFQLKSIKFINKKDEKEKASFQVAEIEFNSQKQFYRFQSYYDQCLYMGRYLKVEGIQSVYEATTLSEEMILQFSWNSWKSHQKAFISFEDEETTDKAEEYLKTEGVKVDNKKVKYSRQSATEIVLDGLNIYTDEHYLQTLFSAYGKIKNVQILKTPVKENLQIQQEMIIEQIHKLYPNDNLDIRPRNLERLKNGLRRCQVLFKDIDKLNDTMISLQGKLGVAGLGRLHVTSWFTYPIQVPFGYLPLYEELLDHAMKDIDKTKLVVQHTAYKDHDYIKVKSHMKQLLDAVKQKMKQEIAGYPVDMSGLEVTILLSEVGIQNLFDLEEKYNCRLLPNFNEKTLLVQTNYENLKKIKEEIKAKAQDNFFYRIPLTRKAFKNFKDNPDSYLCMKNQYHLSLLELEEVGKNILLEGSANHVQAAFNYLMHVIQAASKPDEDILNADVCGICCQESFRPYRLQQCGHKFCLQCIVDTANSALGDMSMFPIKCPQCLAELVVQDLNSVITVEMWPRLLNMSLNQYVGRNPEIVSSCYTAGCKQVNFIIKDYFKCDLCNDSYCTDCKLNYHPGMTCEEAKQGGNVLFEKFMKQNNIRKCPNESCKFPIERVDGCYRVTCTRCNKSMCFKCDADKMIAYDDYNACYKHLQDVHGGYW